MKTSFSCYYTIAGITLQFQTTELLACVDRFAPFRSGKSADYLICFEKVSELPSVPITCLYEGNSYLVAENLPDDYDRWFFDPKRDRLMYAHADYDWSRKKIQVQYLPEGRNLVSYIDSCFSYIAWETLLMHEKRLLLHSSFVASPYGGILFSGVSGIGKSTQADLWCHFRGCRLLNGDRTILHFEDDRLTGYGSPYAGSSKCYVNDSCTIRILVFLQKSTECRIRKLRKAEAFRNIYAQLTVNSWDKEFVQFACDMAEQIADTIPIYELSCTPDLKAVELLEKVLREGEAYGESAT